MSHSSALTPVALVTGKHVLVGDTFAFDHGGFLSRLPCGAELEVVGEGFSDRTVKVLLNGISYFVFLRDLEQGADYPVALYA